MWLREWEDLTQGKSLEALNDFGDLLQIDSLQGLKERSWKMVFPVRS